MGASKAFSTALLFLVNCVLLAAGALVLYGSIHAKNSDWFDVADSYWDGADSVLTGFEIVGGVILGIAVLGTIATLCRWRFGLLLYAFVIFLVLILFVAVAVFGFIVRNRANDWKGKSYPADSDEKSLKPEFDRVYCYAQGAYICNEMNVTEAASIFFPSVANSTLLASFSTLKGVNAMCDALLSSIPSLSSVCSGCKQAKDAENFTSILDWANDKCPRTSQTLLWCGTYLGSGDDSSITTGTAPYTQCRPEFLSYVSRTARTVAAASVSIACGALLVIIFSCILRRREREDEYNNVAFAGGNTMGTPQYPNNAYSTPQTSQPLYGNQPNNLYSKV